MPSNRKVKLIPVLFTVVALLLIAAIVAGCTGTGTPARGWSGTAVIDGNLYAGSNTGKLVGLEADNGNRLFNDVSLETGSSGGFLGCGAAPIVVALYGNPTVLGNQVFVASYNGKVYSIDAAKGIKGWTFQPERGPQPIIGGLALSGNSLFFGTNSGYVYSIDATTSSQNWEFKAGTKIWGTPLVDNGIVYIGTFNKKLYAIDAATGKEKWHFDADGSIVGTPAIQNNVLYFGTLNRSFYAVDAATGNLKWQAAVQAGNWYWANPIVLNDVVYAPNMDHKVYLFKAANGQQIIEPLNAGSPLSSTPVVYKGNIILGGEDGRTWKLDTTKNVLNQLVDKSLSKIYAPLAVDSGIIYIHAQDNNLYAVNADTGVVLWTKSLSG